MNASSEKRIRQLHPALASALRQVIADLADRGLLVEIVQGQRTFAEQDALYAQGRTTPGQIVTQARGGESNHNYGLAADLCPFVNGKPNWDAPLAVWATLGATAIERGLEWGGAWKKFLDKPHVQLPSITIMECASCHRTGGLAAVWALASTRVGWEEPAPESRKIAASRRRVASRALAGWTAGATEKRVTVILYASDRSLWTGATLQVTVTDLFASAGPRIVFRGKTDVSTVELRLDLPFDAGQVYAVAFSAPQHRPAWQFVRRQDFIRAPEQIEKDDLILRLMLVPDQPGTTDVGEGYARLLQAGSPLAAPDTGIDASAFGGLDSAAQMAFLNIESKLRETTIDGAPLLSFVRAVRHVAVDRVFLSFDAALKARMPRAPEFAGAPGHPAPKTMPDLPPHPDSWKHTRFAEGNLQLSFSGEAEPNADGGSAALVHSADVDIDLGRGLAHAKEWLHNNVFEPGHKTNQALVYAMLYAQGILPAYTLDPVAQPGSRALPRSTRRRVARAPARKPKRRVKKRRPS
ncbi:MAG: M15 family metallopeptidase [Vicinamibacterales bacterium]